MTRQDRRESERALSEGTGVAILVGVTIVVTATVGMNVLVVAEQDTGPSNANFSYRYVDASSALLVTHETGTQIRAGNLLITGPDAEVRWAAAAGVNESTAIGPGDTVQISQRNAYGEPVQQFDTITIHYAANETRAKLSTWNDG